MVAMIGTWQHRSHLACRLATLSRSVSQTEVRSRGYFLTTGMLWKILSRRASAQSRQGCKFCEVGNTCDVLQLSFEDYHSHVRYAALFAECLSFYHYADVSLSLCLSICLSVCVHWCGRVCSFVIQPSYSKPRCVRLLYHHRCLIVRSPFPARQPSVRPLQRHRQVQIAPVALLSYWATGVSHSTRSRLCQSVTSVERISAASVSTLYHLPAWEMSSKYQ